MKDIRRVVFTENPSVQTALEESVKKLQLYMGHCVGAKVQQDKISQAMEALKRDGEGRRHVIYFEFKMK